MDTYSNNNNLNPTCISLNCLQINLDRCMKAFHELSVYLSNNPCDIAFISEPYTGKNDIMKTVTGYTTYQYPSNSSVKAALLIKNNICSTLGITEFSDSNICIVQIKTKGGKKYYLISVYIEPRNDINNTIQKLDFFLQKFSGNTCIIGGDFNGWHSMWGSRTNNRRGNIITDLITSHNLLLCNTGNTPTFETITHGRQRQSIIDLTFTTNSNSVSVTSWKVDPSLCFSSQHHGILFQVNLGRDRLIRNLKLSTFRYNTSHVKWDQLNDRFVNEVSSRLSPYRDINKLDRNGIDSLIKSVNKALIDTCDKLLPRSGGVPQRPPWWDSRLDELKRKAIQIHHKLIKHKRRNLPLDEILKEKEKIRKEYSETFCTASTTNFKEFCSKQKKEDVWSITNRIIKSKPLSQPPATLQRSDGSYSSDSRETARILIDQFYPDDTSDVTEEQKNQRRQLNKPVDTPAEPPFSTDEIIETLKSMNPKRAPGSDHLTADICLQFAKAFPKLITDLLNRCLELGYFPEIWKIAYAKIIPKPNKTSYSDITAFRPIGLICVFGKLLEKLIINRLNYFIDCTKQSCPKQFGFKQQTSTVMAIDCALKFIKQAKSMNNHVIAVSLDIKSAFDHAWWPAIFHRLRNMKCPSNIYNILCNYIENRKVSINFADCTVSKTMTRGCIQGSVCGPTLWNLILDQLFLCELPPGCHLQAYADDVLLICHSMSVNDLETKLNTALDIVFKWGKSVKLEFGPEKTQAIGFTNKSTKCKIVVNDKTLQFHSYIKYLGVVIDRKLNFIKHSELLIDKVKKLHNKLVTFVKPTWGIHPENLKILYSQVIEPIVCYAASIWSHSLKYKLVSKKFLSLQRLFAIKIVQGFRTVSTAASITLAQLVPITAKIKEIANIEHSKLLGTCQFLPSDIPIEFPASPSELLHPSQRTGIEFEEVNSLDDFAKLRIRDSWQVYTDGSKTDNYVGAAFATMSPDGTTVIKKYKLHSACSIFQAELLSILKACEWIVGKNITTKCYILSDSKSGLTELQNPYSHNTFAVKIQNVLHHARQLGIILGFLWVRAHIGIPGNEIADTAAKDAARLHKQPDYFNIPISYVKYNLKLESQKAAKDLYEHPSNCLHTKSLLPTFEYLTLYLSKVKPYFAITQLLTNHGYHKAYLNRFKITPDNLCPCDQQTPQTLNHLIKDCIRFEKTRNDHKITSSIYKIDPFNLCEIISKETTTDTFHSHIVHIIKNLKLFNN